MLGAVQGGATREGNEVMVVPAIDAQSPICQLNLVISRRKVISRISAHGDLVAAVREEPLPTGPIFSTIVLARPSDDTFGAPPTVAYAAEAGSRIHALQLSGERLLWLEANAEGFRGRIHSRRVEGGQLVGETCSWERLGADLQVKHATIEGDVVMVAGNLAGEHTIEAFRVPPVGAPCPEEEGAAERFGARRLEREPLALAVDRGDAYVWQEGPDGRGRLVHHDFRLVDPLHPGGAERVVGADADRGGLALSIRPNDVPTVSQLVELRGQEQAIEGAAFLTPRSPIQFHPRHVPGGVAFLRPRCMLAEAEDPAAFTASPTEQLRDLLVYEVPEAPSAWSTMQPTVVELPSGLQSITAREVAGLFVTVDEETGAALVVLTSVALTRPPVVLFRPPGSPGSWRQIDVDLDEARVIGAVDGKLVLIRDPGQIFGERPAPYAEVVLVDASEEALQALVAGEASELPDGGVGAGEGGLADAGAQDGGASSPPLGATSGRIAAGAFLHVFRAIERVEDTLYLYDTSASPAVLWRVTPGPHLGAPDDGRYRPLTDGAGVLGASAFPRSFGRALYFLRRIDSGIALMRYRPLMP